MADVIDFVIAKERRDQMVRYLTDAAMFMIAGLDAGPLVALLAVTFGELRP
jgi:hypothetical protein